MERRKRCLIKLEDGQYAHVGGMVGEIGRLLGGVAALQADLSATRILTRSAAGRGGAPAAGRRKGPPASSARPAKTFALMNAALPGFPHAAFDAGVAALYDRLQPHALAAAEHAEDQGPSTTPLPTCCRAQDLPRTWGLTQSEMCANQRIAA